MVRRRVVRRSKHEAKKKKRGTARYPPRGAGKIPNCVTTLTRGCTHHRPSARRARRWGGGHLFCLRRYYVPLDRAVVAREMRRQPRPSAAHAHFDFAARGGEPACIPGGMGGPGLQHARHGRQAARLGKHLLLYRKQVATAAALGRLSFAVGCHSPPTDRE